MAAPIADKIILPLGRGKWPRILGVHKFAPDDRHERRVAASLRYRTTHPERNREIKRTFVTECRKRVDALKAGPCVDCGGTFPPECMDFDHVQGQKVKNIAAMIDYGQARLEAELEKCELVCANCHRTRTKNRRAF